MVLLVFFVSVFAGYGGGETSAPPMPKDDPDHGIYNYEHAKALGIRVRRVPAAENLCPQTADDGFSPAELDTPEERAAAEREMATASTCTVDPRLGLVVIGYSVEAVRAAPTAFEKGRIICSGAAISLLALEDARGYDRIARERLRKGYGVDPSDSLADLVAGCRTTQWGASMLLPD
jgi:hypothetical protein